LRCLAAALCRRPIKGLHGPRVERWQMALFFQVYEKQHLAHAGLPVPKPNGVRQGEVVGPPYKVKTDDWTITADEIVFLDPATRNCYGRTRSIPGVDRTTARPSGIWGSQFHLTHDGFHIRNWIDPAATLWWRTSLLDHADHRRPAASCHRAHGGAEISSRSARHQASRPPQF